MEPMTHNGAGTVDIFEASLSQQAQEFLHQILMQISSSPRENERGHQKDQGGG